jgi:hypothetical protein
MEGLGLTVGVFPFLLAVFSLPAGSTGMGAFPPVFGLRPPLTVRTIDFGLVLHSCHLAAYQRQTSDWPSHDMRCFAT